MFSATFMLISWVLDDLVGRQRNQPQQVSELSLFLIVLTMFFLFYLYDCLCVIICVSLSSYKLLKIIKMRIF